LLPDGRGIIIDGFGGGYTYFIAAGLAEYSLIIKNSIIKKRIDAFSALCITT